MRDCNVGQVIINEREAAKIYFHFGEYIDDGKMLTAVGRDKYVFINKEDFNKGMINITNKPCIFYNQKENKCMLSDYLKPSICKGEKEENNTISNLLDLKLIKFPKWTKKEMKKRFKTLKEDMVLYTALWQLESLVESETENIIDIGSEKIPTKVGDTFNVEYNYMLVLQDNKINAVRHTRLVALKEEYIPVAKLYNYLSRYFTIIPIEYQHILKDKLNRLFKGVTLKPGNDALTKIDSAIVHFLSMYRIYQMNFTNKSSRHKSIIPANDVYNILKNINFKYEKDR